MEVNVRGVEQRIAHDPKVNMKSEESMESIVHRITKSKVYKRFFVKDLVLFHSMARMLYISAFDS